MKKIRYLYLAKPLKLYGLLILILAGMSLFYFLRKKPNESYRVKKREQENNYMFNEFDEPAHQRNIPFEGEKIVHFDLKGAPPKISYYLKLFPLLSKLGSTGILMEYEDMFPYSGELNNISALNAYSLEDIRKINEMAKENNLKVIPLIQTFGHMEFILKLSDYKNYREVPAYPQVICPTHENTLKLITAMIEQVIAAHPGAEMIHIGADEVYYLGICSRCTDAMLKYNLSKNLLFLEHINNIIDIINRRYPHIRILMWDDQIRSISLEDLKKEHFIDNIEPVVWRYTKDVYEELGPTLWNSYNKVFTKVWAASAFKGATGSNQFVSDVTHYLQNHRSWLSLIQEYKDHVNFQGIILTGWQRYDHFAVLCELLPVGIPTLAMSLRLLLGYSDSPLSPPTEVAKILQCEQPYALIGSVFGSPHCSYPGGNILEYVLHLQQLKQEFETILEDPRVHGWLDNYNIKHKFSNPNHVDSVTAPLSRIKSDLSQIDNGITTAMYEIYDNYTIEEWKETYIKPFEKRINAMWEAKKNILSKDSWPRRPLRDEI
uniref:beta-N-acetylhexosaminidase n=1 Tax=Anoplophora glabripennis TaxID=217634 RepID=V5GYD2_ANOGL